MDWLKTIVLCALGAMAQDDAASIGSALLVVHGSLDLAPALLGCYLGTAAGDLLTIAVGAALGRRALRWRWIRKRLDEDRVERMSRWITETHRGSSVVFLSRFAAGLRTVLHLAIGMLHMSWGRIAPLVLAAGMIHVGVVFTAVLGAGETVRRLVGDGGFASAWPMLFVGAAAWLLVRFVGRWISRAAAPTPIAAPADQSPEAAPLER